MKVIFVNQSKKRMPRSMIDRWLNACEKRLLLKDQKKLKNKELLVVFVPRAQMKALNSQFRAKNEPTDILSFESVEEGSIGELVLSPKVIMDQSKRTGLTYHQELCYMVLHGLLHLLGYDHETSKKEARKMFALQNKLFEALAERFDFR